MSRAGKRTRQERTQKGPASSKRRTSLLTRFTTCGIAQVAPELQVMTRRRRAGSHNLIQGRTDCGRAAVSVATVFFVQVTSHIQQHPVC